MKLWGLLARMRRNERSNLLFLAAADLRTTVGSAAMTTDMIRWTLSNRELQGQAKARGC